MLWLSETGHSNSFKTLFAFLLLSDKNPPRAVEVIQYIGGVILAKHTKQPAQSDALTDSSPMHCGHLLAGHNRPQNLIFQSGCKAIEQPMRLMLATAFAASSISGSHTGF
jgi:hypothetical protein